MATETAHDTGSGTSAHPEPQNELVVKTDTPRKSAVRQNYLRADGMGTVAAEDYDPAKHGKVIEESDEQFMARTRARIASSSPGGHPPTTIANLQNLNPANLPGTPAVPVVPVVGPTPVGQPVATVEQTQNIGTDGKPVVVQATAGTHLPGTTGLPPGTPTGTTVVPGKVEGKDNKPSPEAQLTGAAAAPQGTAVPAGSPTAPAVAVPAAVAPTAAAPVGTTASPLAPPTFSAPGTPSGEPGKQ